MIYVSLYQFSLFKSCNNNKQKYFVKLVTFFILDVDFVDNTEKISEEKIIIFPQTSKIEQGNL